MNIDVIIANNPVDIKMRIFPVFIVLVFLLFRRRNHQILTNYTIAIVKAIIRVRLYKFNVRKWQVFNRNPIARNHPPPSCVI